MYKYTILISTQKKGKTFRKSAFIFGFIFTQHFLLSFFTYLSFAYLVREMSKTSIKKHVCISVGLNVTIRFKRRGSLIQISAYLFCGTMILTHRQSLICCLRDNKQRFYLQFIFLLRKHLVFLTHYDQCGSCKKA